MTGDDGPNSEESLEEDTTESKDSKGKKPAPTIDSDEVPRDIREKIWNADVPRLTYTEEGQFSEGVMRGEDGAMAGLVGPDLSDSSTLTIDSFEAFQGDLNNDGKPEYVVSVYSTGGGTGWDKMPVIYDADVVPQDVIEIPSELRIYRGGPTVTGIDGDKISMEWTGFTDRDPLCCGSLKGSGIFTWDGETLHPVDGPHFS